MKRKRSFTLIIVLLILAALSVWIWLSRNSRGGAVSEDREFSYKDTASLTKIFIADKEGSKSLIRRTPKGWVVNDKFPCRSEAVLNLLEAIRNVEVKMPVAREAKEPTLKYMSSNAIKVELYRDDELVKQFYVGHETADGEASYMLLTDLRSGKNYNDPYICFIPGFTGYLQPRFIANENEWRDRIVLNFVPPQIMEINVRYYDAPADSSFSILLNNTTDFILRNGKGEELAFDKDRVKQYLAYFQNISYEGLITGKNRKLQDSLRSAGQFCTITVSEKAGSVKRFNFYRKQFTDRMNPEVGVTYNFDPDRLYLSFDNDREWAIIQYFVFGKLLVYSSYFREKSSVKK